MSRNDAVSESPRAQDFAAALLVAIGPMTVMKLQKLLYYVQAWHLARFGARAFPEAIEAWAMGPVVRSVYRNHRGSYTVSGSPGDAALVGGTRREVLEWVVGAYGGFSAEQLSAMTHAEVPWLVARGGIPDGVPSEAPIRDDLMENFYARQTLGAAEAVETAAASAALEGLQISDEWQRAVAQALGESGEAGGVDALVEQRLQKYRAR